MHYKFNEFPSVVTEERLSGIICEGVKEYLNEVTECLFHYQEQAMEHLEIIDTLTTKNEALQQQVAELKECLKACHAASSRGAMSFNHKVGTVVAHADQVTLQYQAS